jgi:hypothetical protein
MIYEALYGKDGYDAALKQVKHWISSDGYYRAPHGSGAASLAEKKYGWPAGCRGKKAKPDPFCPIAKPEESQIDEFAEIQWMSCTGNIARLTFDHAQKSVTLLIDSRRHGIPSVFYFCGNDSPTPQSVLRYETQQPTWQWWENADMKREGAERGAERRKGARLKR